MPKFVLQLASFQLFRSDCKAVLSKGWRYLYLFLCQQWLVSVTLQHCSPDLESLFIILSQESNCKPSYSPCEFMSLILVSVYIPQQANVQCVQCRLTKQMIDIEQIKPDSLVIILGDFSKGNLITKFPTQHRVNL